MTYLKARQRIAWIGILIWTGVCGFLLWQGYQGSQMEWEPTRLTATLVLMALMVLVSLPMDWLGGYWLVHRYSRSSIKAGEWWLGWAKAATIQSLIMGLNLLVLGAATVWLGWLGALGWLFISMMIFLGFQFYLHVAMTWQPHVMENNQGRLLFVVDTADRTFTGGIFGIPGKESIVYPKYWQERFGKSVNQLLIARRHGAVNIGSHGRGVLLAIGWNLGLFALAMFLSPELPSTGLGLISTVAIFSLLNLLTQLFPLPAISRSAVYQLDLWTYQKKMNPDDLRKSMEVTHRLREDLGEENLPLSRWAATPTRAMRDQHFSRQKPVKGAWQASRQANFTSWAGFNLLNRVWPDQLGRPDVWVFPPVD